MSDYFDGGFGPSNYMHLKNIYQIELQSPEERDKYQQKLKDKNPVAYEQFLEFKDNIESRIINIKQVILDGADPIINEDLLTNV